WVSLHGIALNVAPDLSHFASIVPCGIADPHYGVTSLADLGHAATMPEVDRALRREFEALFGPTADAREPIPADAEGDTREPVRYRRQSGEIAPSGGRVMSTELIKRSPFTIGALLVYWLRAHNPPPGIAAP